MEAIPPGQEKTLDASKDFHFVQVYSSVALCQTATDPTLEEQNPHH
jgi:hypothetical protein